MTTTKGLIVALALCTAAQAAFPFFGATKTLKYYGYESDGETVVDIIPPRTGHDLETQRRLAVTGACPFTGGTQPDGCTPGCFERKCRNQNSKNTILTMISATQVLKTDLVKAAAKIGKRANSSVVPKTDLEVTDFKVVNEPILGYMPGSSERVALEASLAKYSGECEDIPIIIGGKEYRTDNVQYQVMPHDHSKKIAKFYWATPELVHKGITKIGRASCRERV